MRDELPIDGILGDLGEAVRRHGAAVVVAPPGAGKTTRVPPTLAARVAGRVVVTQPRRVAARAAARRMAEEGGGAVGGEVGYQIRGERKASKRTRVLVVTEGVLVRMLQDDPFLEGVGAVVLDEFHERSLHVDLALAMARHVRHEVRPDLALVVMSATLDPEPVAAFLGDAPVVQAEGRVFPVEIAYRTRRGDRRLSEEVADGVRTALQRVEGDVLAFLPGVGEIRYTERALQREAAEQGVTLAPLFGDLPPGQQDRALRPGRRRRVVLATNVAETSVTVEGVEAVVDGGMARVMRHDPAVGLDRLELQRISRASADQRAGRAGRTGPGWCLRLFGEAEAAQMRPAEDPESRRVDLAGPVLQLLAWGEDPARFAWFEAPDGDALQRAQVLLERLGAVADGRATADGQAMAALPLHPRLARLALQGRRRGHGGAACLVAALLAERPLVRRHEPWDGRWHSRSDVLDRLAAVQHRTDPEVPSPFTDAEVNRGVARRVVQEGRRLARALERGADDRCVAAVDEERALLQAVAEAYPDRVVRRRAKGSPRGLMVGGRGVRLDDESAVVHEPLFVAVDVGAGRRGARSESQVRLASAVEEGWLPAHLRTTETELRFDEQRERVVVREARSYLDLELTSRPLEAGDPERVAEALCEAARAQPERALGLDQGPAKELLARWRFLHGAMRRAPLPDVDPLLLDEALPLLCAGRSSFAELRAAPVTETLLGLLSREASETLRREAPERLRVPSGRRVRLDYPAAGPPVLAAKIQELFGLRETPKVAGGRVPVMVHLLAPNGRPQQVTQDLRSFWKNTYPEVRKELRARYPKHHWPEKA